MTRLSVNVNKIATLRNARGKNNPDLIEVIKKLIHYGVKGITVHPRPDQRHILYNDVRQIRQLLKQHPTVEFNVEGYPDTSFLDLIAATLPTQCTLVPDPPSVLTSNMGWKLQENQELLQKVLTVLKKHSVRSSLFIDPFTLDTVEMNTLKTLKPDRAELYTEAYTNAWLSATKREQVVAVYTKAAQKLKLIGVELNAGHDLNLKNLPFFLLKVPEVKEVSIGHALICESLYQGLEKVVTQYLKICQK